MKLSAILLALLLACPAGLSAQSSVALGLTLPPAALLAQRGPDVTIHGALAGSEQEALIRNGFPARLNFRLELWSAGGWFNRPERSTTWDVFVEYEPLSRMFRVVRIAPSGASDLGSFGDFSEVRAVLERPYQPIIPAPRDNGRYYYSTTLEIERMSATDLAELRQWMNGELRPAIRGDRNPGTAIARGVGALVTRLLGAEKKRYQARSPTFRTGS